jgi:filamentous hemagglutinin family protein
MMSLFSINQTQLVSIILNAVMHKTNSDITGILIRNDY